MSEQKLEAIRKIKKTHENLVVTLGITIGLILCIYFFSFAALIDSAPPIAIQMMMVTTVLFVIALIFVKRIAFFLTKLLLGRKEQCKAILQVIKAADLSSDEQALMQKLS